MLARPRRRREVSGDEETQDEQLGRFTISVTPKKKRLFHFLHCQLKFRVSNFPILIRKITQMNTFLCFAQAL